MTKEDFEKIFPVKKEKNIDDTPKVNPEDSDEINAHNRQITEEAYKRSEHTRLLDERIRKDKKKQRAAERRERIFSYFHNISRSIFNKHIGLTAATLLATGALIYFLNKPNYQSIQNNSKQRPVVEKKVVKINGSIEYVDSLYGEGNLSSMVRKVYGLSKNSEVVKKVNEIVDYNAANNPDKLVKNTITKDGEFVDGRFVNYPKGYDGLKGDLIFKDRRYLFPKKRDTSITLDVLVNNENQVVDNDGNVINESLDNYIQDEMEKGKIEYYKVEVKEIVSSYNRLGLDKVKKMSGLDDREIYNVLDLERKNGGVINYSNAFLSSSQDREYLMNNIVNTYLNSKTNKEALATIEDKFGIKMSKTSLYRVCDNYSKVIDYEGKIRKRYLKKNKKVV